MGFSPTSDSWWLDVKLGARILVKYPGLALVGVFGIAVAIAIAVGGFSIIYRNFLAPSLPLEEGERIVSLQVWDSAAGKVEPRILREYKVWRAELKSVQEISAFRAMTSNLSAAGLPLENVAVAAMSASGFGVVRVRPLMGRHLIEDDEREGAPWVVMIGESVWRDRFGGDPDILGKTLRLGSTSYSIVGVMPESFLFPVNHRFWIPLRPGATVPEPLAGSELSVFGRLASGATLERARIELESIGRQTALAYPETYARLQPQVRLYASPLGVSGEADATDLTAILLMNIPATMLLVLVCLNFAILVYTRTAMRQGEISVRTALGASRSRIVVQLVIEALVLSTAGAVLGVMIAMFVLREVEAVVQQIPTGLPFWVSFQLSPVAVLYAGALSVFAAAIVGLVPALKATRQSGQAVTRIVSDGAGARLGGTWTLMVVAQVGFAVLLLPPAVFNAWDNLRVEFADPGFPAGEFLTAQLATSADRQAELLRRLRAEPQVSNATFALTIPGNERGVLLNTEREAGREARFNRVDVNFFRGLGVPILAGRDFELADGAMNPNDGGVVVVNQSLALQLFGGDALGRRIRQADSDSWSQIVGIVRDFPAGVSPGMKESPLRVYYPAAEGQVSSVALAIRVRGGEPTTFARRLLEVAADVDPDTPLRDIRSLDEALRQEQWIRRVEAGMLGAAALSVLLLSSAGIYALMAFTVSQRRKEIGIRIALGADHKRILASIFSRALGQLAVGATAGAVAAVALDSGNGFMRGNAPVVLPIVVVFMIAVGVLAAIGPARRGLRIEPYDALRDE